MFKRDGQTLGALKRRLPMSRFGVMKHLRVLEEAGLIVTRRRGREKLHFLNAVPIRLVHDRWVSKYAASWTAGLSELKQKLEDKAMEKVFENYIKTSPERLWQAITDPEMRRKYNFSAGVESDWTPGSGYRGVSPFASAPIWEGENLEVDPPRRLVQTFRALWSDDVKREGTSRVTWEIEPIGDSCRLVVTHSDLREDANAELYGGWMMILSGLKTAPRDRPAADDAGLAALRAGSPADRVRRHARPGSSVSSPAVVSRLAEERWTRLHDHAVGVEPVVSNQSWWYAVAVVCKTGNVQMVGPWPDVEMTRFRREKNIEFEGALRLPSSTTAKRKKKRRPGW